MVPLIVGVTGGIGCGKSTICQQFSSLGVPVIDSDHVARDVVSVGQPVLQELKQHFGEIILNADGSLSRQKLREIIFKEPPQKEYIEKLLHPLILQRIQQQLENIEAPYVIIEIPLLIEAGWQTFVDQILVIELPKELQIERITKQRKLDEETLEQIINSQLPQIERTKHADQRLNNSGDYDDISRQVSKLHQQYLQLAQERQQ